MKLILPKPHQFISKNFECFYLSNYLAVKEDTTLENYLKNLLQFYYDKDDIIDELDSNLKILENENDENEVKNHLKNYKNTLQSFFDNIMPIDDLDFFMYYFFESDYTEDDRLIVKFYRQIRKQNFSIEENQINDLYDFLEKILLKLGSEILIITSIIINELIRLGNYDIKINEKLNIKNTKLRYSDINFKFALLEQIGVIHWLQLNIPTNNENRAEILMELIGGSKNTLIDYLKGKTINKDVRQKAIDFINDRRYPK